MRLLLCFVSLGALGAPFEVPANAETTVEVPRVILHLSIPIAHDGIVYYWKGHYQFDPKLPKKCTVKANKMDWPFSNAVSADGAVLSDVEFGCDYNSKCKDHKCNHSVAIGMIWGALLFTAMCIALLFYIRYGACRDRGERVDVADQHVEMGDFLHPNRPRQ